MHKTDLFEGAAWIAGASLLARVVGSVGTLVITHFLAPEVLGEVGVAVILTQTASYLTNMGFAQYVPARNSGPGGAFHVTVFNALGVLVAMLAAVVLAAPVAPWFEAPNMGDYVPGMAVAVCLHRLSIVPESVALRDMRFKTVSLGTALSEFIYTAVSLALAAWGWGGHAIVMGNICQYAGRLLFFFSFVKRREWLQPVRLERETTRDVFSFGTPLFVGQSATFVGTKWDNMLLSSLFGPGILGLYNLAYNLATLPSEHIGSALQDVLMPSFAKMDPERARRAFVRSLGYVAIVVFPLVVGLGAVAETFAVVVFDERWQKMAPYVSVLSTLALASPLIEGYWAFFSARGLTRLNMILGVVAAGTALGLLITFSRWGSLAAAAGVGVGAWTVALLAAVLAQRFEQVSVWSTVRAILGPLLACGLLVLAVLGTRQLAGGVLPPVVLLLLEVLAGALGYLAGVVVFARTGLRELLGMVKDVVARRRGRGDGAR